MLAKIRSLALAFATGVAMLALAPVVPAAAAQAPCNVGTTHVIGVDNVSPAGHNYEYTDFFPRGLPTGSGVKAAFGDCIDFKFAHQADADTGFHTATLLKSTENPTALVSPTNPWQDTPLVVPDAETGEANLQQNPKVIFPSSLGPCGTVVSPCDYTGGARLNSGAPVQGPLNGTGDFVVRDGFDAAQTIYFVCLIHPGMLGSVDLVTAGPTVPPESASAGSVAQYAADTASAAAAEAAASAAGVTTNSNGTRTYTVQAGVAVPHVEVAEMLPSVVNITAGDSVRWPTQTIADIHTVTFPAGSAGSSLDPVTQPLQCEGTPDTTASGPPPTFGCVAGPDPTTTIPVEIPFVPEPAGPTSITSAATLATSGVIANPPAPFPASYTFGFPNAGTFTYQCRVHDHMQGQVLAAAVVAPTLPKAGGLPHAAAPRPGAPLDAGGLLLILFGAIAVCGLVLRRRSL